MKKLPKISEFELSKDIHNNKKVFDSLKEKNENVSNKKNIVNKENDNKIITVKEKIKKLIDQNNYIFNTKVVLVFEDREIETNIAGIVGNHIITMNNEIIKIGSLKDIRF